MGLRDRIRPQQLVLRCYAEAVGGRLFKVTVDCPKEPFTGDLVASMARQAGVSKR
jgi:hypothetical protein